MRPLSRIGRSVTRRRVWLAAGLIAAAGGSPVAMAQNLSGPVLSASISQRFEADSNFQLDDDSAGTSYFADTRLALGFDTESETQSFSLGFDTGLRALWEADEDFDTTVASPSTARLAYAQEWADAAFDTTVRYRQSRVDFDRLDVEFDDIGQPTSLNRLSGETTERRYDATVSLALATDAPSSYLFNFEATHFDYSDNTDNRVPRTTLFGEATWRLDLNPVLATAIVGSYYTYDADDDEDTDLDIAEIDAGLIYAATPNLTIGAGIGYADRQREETIGGVRQVTEDEQGPTARATVNYAFEDFTVVGSARVTDAAPDTRFNGDLRVSYPLPNGRVNARLFQSYTGDSDGDEVRVSGGSIGLVRDLTAVSRLGLTFNAALQENQDNPNQSDIERFDATATFSYDITEQLSADIGYRFRYREEDPDTADSHAVFFVIGRSFETRP